MRWQYGLERLGSRGRTQPASAALPESACSTSVPSALSCNDAGRPLGGKLLRGWFRCSRNCCSLMVTYFLHAYGDDKTGDFRLFRTMRTKTGSTSVLTVAPSVHLHVSTFVLLGADVCTGTGAPAAGRAACYNPSRQDAGQGRPGGGRCGYTVRPTLSGVWGSGNHRAQCGSSAPLCRAGPGLSAHMCPLLLRFCSPCESPISRLMGHVREQLPLPLAFPGPETPWAMVGQKPDNASADRSPN